MYSIFWCYKVCCPIWNYLQLSMVCRPLIGNCIANWQNNLRERNLHPLWWQQSISFVKLLITCKWQYICYLQGKDYGIDIIKLVSQMFQRFYMLFLISQKKKNSYGSRYFWTFKTCNGMNCPCHIYQKINALCIKIGFCLT